MLIQPSYRIISRIILTTCVLSSLLGVVCGQKRDDRTPPPKEEAEAKALVSSFFNRFEETRDITPLIKEFFISDFGRRLKYCGTSGNCRGFAKDFWGVLEVFEEVKARENDFQRLYSLALNDFFLFLRLFRIYKIEFGAELNDFEKIVRKKITPRIKQLLKARPAALKMGLFAEGLENSETISVPKNSRELSRYLRNYRYLVNAMRVVERESFQRLEKKGKKFVVSHSPIDFRIDAEPSNSEFFEFPVGTLITQAWGNESTFFIIDMVREHGKLKIIAVYPPID